MQVKMHNIKAHISRSDITKHCIEIRSIHVHEPVNRMDHICDLFHVSFKYSKRVRVGKHESGNIFIKYFL